MRFFSILYLCLWSPGGLLRNYGMHTKSARYSTPTPQVLFDHNSKLCSNWNCYSNDFSVCFQQASSFASEKNTTTNFFRMIDVPGYLLHVISGPCRRIGFREEKKPISQPFDTILKSLSRFHCYKVSGGVKFLSGSKRFCFVCASLLGSGCSHIYLLLGFSFCYRFVLIIGKQ